MPDPLEYIVKDALMMCDKGAAPGMFTPTFNTTVKVSTCIVSTKADKIPIVNIPAFGACAVKGGAPCTPTPVEWLDTYEVKVKGQETILYRCKLPCGSGGKIEFITSGQIPIPAEEYDKLLEEHGEEEDGLSWWDGAELIPFAGGVIGTVRSGSKGDWLGVGLSLGSVVLDVGGLFSFGAGNGASAAVKGGKLARTGVKAANAMTKAGKAIRLTGKAARAFASAAAKSVDNIALKTGKICVFACFPAGTRISVKDGYKNVEDVQIGDLVWAYNEETGESDLKPVVNTMQNEVDTTIKITLEDEVIESTVEHPFYTRSGWKNAANLTTEDEIRTKNGLWGYIKKVAFEYQKKKVYNFEVGDWHTYFVGAWAWLVHNACYKTVFFKAFPGLKGKVVVHHAIEQQVLKKYPGLFDEAFMHSLDNLRGIPKSLNNTLHLSTIRKDWNKFYRTFDNAGKIPTRRQVLNYARNIDKKYGHLFDPPLK